jgi:tRNA A37 threonylcarbamoyladenosine dehydratase
MAERVLAINPSAHVEAVKDFYEARTAPSFLARRPDVIVDAIDNITAKLHLLATCIYRAMPVVTALGASAKVDPTRVRVADLRKTHDDPLAKTIRKNLWRVYAINLKRVSRLHAIYSDEEVILPDPAYRSSLCGLECACPNQANQHHTCARRRLLYGSAVFVTSVFGMIAAGLVTRFLAGDSRVDLRPTFKVLDGDEPLRDPDERWRDGTLVDPIDTEPLDESASALPDKSDSSA